ncbi:MAG: 3-dehydroquinate synthase [Propionicimonas sp.]|nr:3-dehydroquinate synthase [Propionicimonas sp.]
MSGWDPVDVFAEQPYQVLIEHGVSALLPEFLDGVDKVAIIHPPCLEHLMRRINDSLEQQVVSIGVPEAERGKTPAVLEYCWESLAEAGFTRSDAIIGLGGGATTDLAGFVAATWLRGVRYIAMPTTVLAMVDAAVGGKTGINLPAGKNLVGAFHEPFTVLGDLDYLDSLPDAELRSGFAEVLKCGFIADPEILTEFEEDPAEAITPSARQARLIRRAVAVKAAVVSGDLRERTSEGDKIGREALNYGHTLGHAIERNEGFTWRHGQAVSVGMVYAAELAHRLDLIDAGLVQRHRDVLARAGLPTGYANGAWPELRSAISLDKKSRGHTVRFVLLKGLAAPAILANPGEETMQEAYQAIAEAG